MEKANRPGGDYAYVPAAIYYEDADSLEYVRRDEPCVYRRVDCLLTLVLSMRTREPLGFQLKGFRHFYLEHIRGKLEVRNQDFSQLIVILEEAVKLLGDRIFSENDRTAAYMKARNIAEEDEVRIPDLPIVA